MDSKYKGYYNIQVYDHPGGGAEQELIDIVHIEDFVTPPGYQTNEGYVTPMAQKVKKVQYVYGTRQDQHVIEQLRNEFCNHISPLRSSVDDTHNTLRGLLQEKDNQIQDLNNKLAELQKFKEAMENMKESDMSEILFGQNKKANDDEIPF